MIPVCQPLITKQDAQGVVKALKRGWISGVGPHVKAFENDFARLFHRKYGVAVSNGTSALHLALKALGIKKGDEVIIPDFAMIAVLFAVLYCEATPVLVDVERDTGNIDANEIKKAISKRTRAIIAVHTYGHPCDMQAILKICKQKKIYLIEDVAEAHGALYKGKPCGSFGDAACFSFYANKIITTGEGGMVLTDSKSIARQCDYYRNLCFPLKKQRIYQHHDLGFNYRLGNLHAALGLTQLRSFQDRIKKRNRIARMYGVQFKNFQAVKCPIEKKYAQRICWMYNIIVDHKKTRVNRDQLMKRLAKKGIETRPYFQPLHRQKCLKSFKYRKIGQYKNSRWLAGHGLYLPSSSNLSSRQIKMICESIKKIIKSY